jgi:hypothetical protein
MHSLPDRVEGPLLDAAFGYRIRNFRYRMDNDISDVVATRDLKRLCDLDLLSPVGEKRGRYYVARDMLLAITEKTRDRSRSADPYEMVAIRQQAEQLELTV